MEDNKIKLSDLTELTQVGDEDILLVTDYNGSSKTSKKATAKKFKDYVLGGIDLSDYYTKEEIDDKIGSIDNALDYLIEESE